MPDRPAFPAVFISHGSPMVAIETDDYTRALGSLGARYPDARALVVVSAHWQEPWPLRVTAWQRSRIIHDFGGFPEPLYRLDYPAPGAPDLAAEIAERLSGSGHRVALDRERGLDHGAWVPLRLAWPAATIPVIEVSLPAPATPRQLFDVGRALSPLRRQGVLFIGSGGMVHNLRRVRFADEFAPVDDWAAAFDEWVAARIAEGALEALFSYGSLAPHASLAVPTTEHFDPLFVVLGAVFEDEKQTSVYAGFRYGNLSMRSLAFGDG
jgi:4,5-DOPA dioxygenase extradiol